ncbi:putative leucine-rich repeat receptor-like protein kinase [Forsythia ovata]|uniref:Leucine-rich repeat receptor-like protein kinase n=1 Tax=Forsythia ovata TaxID=205694 RepID=A0ABD1PVL1_9LAMI
MARSFLHTQQGFSFSPRKYEPPRTGLLNSLTFLTQLGVFSLKQNNFSDPISVLLNLTNLKFLFLFHNEFSGDFPVSVVSLSKLYRLDLSYNNLSGIIHLSINHLTHLLTLRWEGNKFSGSISGLRLLSLQDFNVSGNALAARDTSFAIGVSCVDI